MMGLGDRLRLRPLVAAIKGDVLYVSSELSAVHLVEPEIDEVWIPQGGQPVIGRLGVRPGFPDGNDAWAEMVRCTQRQEASHA